MPPNTNSEQGGEHTVDEAFIQNFAGELSADYPGFQLHITNLLATDLHMTAKVSALQSISDVARERRSKAYATVEPELISTWPPAITQTTYIRPKSALILRAWVGVLNYMDEFHQQPVHYRAGVVGGTALACTGLVESLSSGLNGVDPISHRPVPIAAFILGLGIVSYSHDKMRKN